MKDRSGPGTALPGEEEPFLRRWSRRKLNPEEEDKVPAAAVPPPEQEPEPAPPGDEEMPSLESLTPDSDYSLFLSPRVSESLRKMALRKLFHSPAFNLCDGLDDYDEDFRRFTVLGEVVTVEMRRRLEELVEEAGADCRESPPTASIADERSAPEEPRAGEDHEPEEDEEVG